MITKGSSTNDIMAMSFCDNFNTKKRNYRGFKIVLFVMSIMDDPLSGIFFCNRELIDQHMFQDIVVT